MLDDGKDVECMRPTVFILRMRGLVKGAASNIILRLIRGKVRGHESERRIALHGHAMHRSLVEHSKIRRHGSAR